MASLSRGGSSPERTPPLRGTLPEMPIAGAAQTQRLPRSRHRPRRNQRHERLQKQQRLFLYRSEVSVGGSGAVFYVLQPFVLGEGGCRQ